MTHYQYPPDSPPGGPQGQAIFLIGEEGQEGAIGTPGVAGAAGVAGNTGATGNTGAVGNTGATGSSGPAGPAIFLLGEAEPAEIAYPGPAGLAGAAGPAGAPDVTRISGNSGVAGNTITWQVLTGASSTTGVTPGVVMTTSTVGVGVWTFKYTLLFGTSAATTGVKFNVNHTGTLTGFATHMRYVDTAATASTGTADDITSAVAAGVVGGYAEAVKNTSTVASAGVGVANAINLGFLEGVMNVSVSGNMELKFASEVDASQATIFSNTALELHRVG